MKYLYLIIIAFILQSFSLFAQSQSWSSLTNGNNVYSIFPIGDSLLCTTNAGIIKIHKNGTGFRLINLTIHLNYLTSAIQDSLGNIWIGSSDGLFKFSNNGIITSVPMPSNLIYFIKMHNMNIWVSYYGGLAMFNGSFWTYYHTGNSSIPSNVVFDLAFSSNGTAWIATSNGLASFDGTNWQIYDTTNTIIETSEIRAIAVDHNDKVWIATIDQLNAGGLAANINMFDGSIWFDYPNAIYPGDVISTIACDINNNVFFGSKDDFINGWFSTGLVRYNGSNFNMFYASNSTFGDENINQLVSDNSGNVFLATQSDYVTSYNAPTFTHIVTGNCKIASEEIRAIDISSQNKVYATSMNYTYHWDEQYISYYNGTRWIVCTSIEAKSKFVKFIDDSTAWIGFDLGLYEMQDSIATEILSTSGTNAGEARDVAIDQSGNKWLATDGGLIKYDGSAWLSYETFNSQIPTNQVYSIVVDNMNKKWLGTDSGIVVFNDTSWSVYNNSNLPGLPTGGVISEIETNGMGDFWAAINDGNFNPTGLGMVYFKEVNNTIANLQFYSTSNSNLPSDLIKDLQYAMGKLWIATDSGAVEFDTLNMVVYKMNNSGLMDDFITDIAVDSSGSIYFATNHFVSILDETPINTNISESIQHSHYNVFPNPALSEIIIKRIHEDYSLVNFSLYDIAGKRILNSQLQPSESETRLNLHGLNSGIYFLKLESDQSDYESIKISVQ